MMNILEKIIDTKRREVALNKLQTTLHSLQESVYYFSKSISLKDSLLQKKSSGIIAEFKRKSPSKGFINSTIKLADVINGYKKFASGISVLTDEQYFGGHNEDLIAARKIAQIPLLRKDFIIDEYQLHEAKAIGADIVLLIAACLSPKEVEALAKKAKLLNLEVLLELHDEEELNHICNEVDMVGINNRNLKTFEVDIDRSLRMAEKIPADKIKIAESGINSVENIRLFGQHGFKGFLIGENFMKHENPAIAFENFIKKLNAT